MDRLVEGYRRFRSEVWPEQRARYETLATRGQSPDTLVLTCADSRVDPQTVFGAVPGELFVVRNVAGLVPPYEPDAHYHGTSAALEYGVRVLKVNHLVVLGHAQCGGIQAMVEGAPRGAQDFVEPWMKIAEDVLRKQPPAEANDEDRRTFYETEVVRLTLANLLTFPWIDEAVREGRLRIHGCWFGIARGSLTVLDGDRFVAVA